SEGHVAFQLSLDRAVYVVNPTPEDGSSGIPLLTARITLRNTTEQPVELEFPSAQKFDLVLRNDQGEIVFQWSADKTFVQSVQQEEVKGGERNWVVPAVLASRDGAALPTGKYVAEVWLTTSGARSYSSSVAFRIEQAEAQRPATSSAARTEAQSR